MSAPHALRSSSGTVAVDSGGKVRVGSPVLLDGLTKIADFDFISESALTAKVSR
jgi:hypothetical protein